MIQVPLTFEDPDLVVNSMRKINYGLLLVLGWLCCTSTNQSLCYNLCNHVNTFKTSLWNTFIKACQFAIFAPIVYLCLESGTIPLAAEQTWGDIQIHMRAG